MSRPTLEQITEAREHCRDAVDNDLWPDPNQVDVLLAATEPPTDEEIADAYAESFIPRSSERMADRRADLVRDVALTIHEPVATLWAVEVHAARTVRRFFGSVKS